MKYTLLGCALLVCLATQPSVGLSDVGTDTALAQGEENPWTIGAVSDQASALDYDAARHAAQEELESLAAQPRIPIMFRALDDWSKLTTAALGEPYLYYWAGAEFVGYRDAAPDAILEYMRGFSLEFPIIVDGEALGTLNMSIDPKTGKYVRRSISDGATMYRMVLDAREHYPKADGWTVAVVNTGIAGQYFYLTHEMQEPHLSPATSSAAHILGMPPSDVGTGVSVPLAKASASIKIPVSRVYEQQHR